MTLEYITEYIDRKISVNENVIKITFYELRIKENLSEEDTFLFLKMSKRRLRNLGYSIYETGEKYLYDGKEQTVDINILYVAIKNK